MSISELNERDTVEKKVFVVIVVVVRVNSFTYVEYSTLMFRGILRKPDLSVQISVPVSVPAGIPFDVDETHLFASPCIIPRPHLSFFAEDWSVRISTLKSLNQNSTRIKNVRPSI